MSKKKGLIISISVILLLIIAFYAFIFIVLPKGLAEHEKEDYGFIRLPNNYCVTKISANDSRLGLAKDNDVIDSIVNFDINAIAWNDRYVFYHISNTYVMYPIPNQNKLAEKWPGSKRFQILDTKAGKISTYLTLDEANQALAKLGVGTLNLRSVDDFFPETKGTSHPFTLN
jgi:hypothetical protein